MTVPDLIIFDCDGTLVDSEYLNNKATADVLAALGLPQYDTDYCLRHFAGKGMGEMAAVILDETGVILPDDFIGRYMALVHARMPNELHAIPGVEAALIRLEGDCAMCVASNGERSNVLRSLRLTGLDRYFTDDCVFTKDMVPNPKPAPDLFLCAARRMGAAPSRCIVVEDSVTGTTAGVAAGMEVIGFVGTYAEKAAQAANLRAAGAVRIVERFADVLALILDRGFELSTGT